MIGSLIGWLICGVLLVGVLLVGWLCIWWLVDRLSFLISSPCGRVEHDRSLPRQWAEHTGSHRRDQRLPLGDYPVVHLLPAEQAPAHHTPDQRGAVHRPAAQLHGGYLRQVHSTSPVTEIWTLMPIPSIPLHDAENDSYDFVF